MIKFIIFIVSIILSNLVLANNGKKEQKLNVDVNRSEVAWIATKVVGSQSGFINIKDGFLIFKNEKIQNGEFNIDMNSIVCNSISDTESNKKLIDHLKNDDFFSVDKFPTAKIIIKEVIYKGTEIEFKADLTIKGITNPILFTATEQFSGNDIIYKAKIKVNRIIYGIHYNSDISLGDKLIHNEFTLDTKIIINKNNK